MIREIVLPYTAYKNLKEGDEFIRVAMLPVLLRDIQGVRDGAMFTPSEFGRGQALEVRRMVMMPGGWLKEIDLSDNDEENEDDESEPLANAAALSPFDEYEPVRIYP